MLHEEIIRSCLISGAIIPVMIIYLIYGFTGSRPFISESSGGIFLAGVLVMLIAACVYIPYAAMLYGKTIGHRNREFIQVALYSFIAIGIFLFYVGARKLPNDTGNFSLGYIWFAALAITHLTYMSFYLPFWGLSLIGLTTTVSIYEAPGTLNYIQYYLVFFVCFFGGLVIRSYSFTSSYLKDKIRMQNEKNESLSMTDTLTGIENRRGLEAFIDLKKESWNTHSETVSVLFFDIDCFKLYNDSYGHIKGDETLKEVTALVQKCFTNNLNMFRFGGDEFVIILEEPDPKRIRNFAVKLRESIYSSKIPAPSGAPYDYLTISIGVKTEVVGEDYSYQKQIGEADKLMYSGRDDGKGLINDNGEIVKD